MTDRGDAADFGVRAGLSPRSSCRFFSSSVSGSTAKINRPSCGISPSAFFFFSSSSTAFFCRFCSSSFSNARMSVSSFCFSSASMRTSGGTPSSSASFDLAAAAAFRADLGLVVQVARRGFSFFGPAAAAAAAAAFRCLNNKLAGPVPVGVPAAAEAAFGGVETAATAAA